MTADPDDPQPQELRELDRRAKEALRDCEELLQRTRRLLKDAEQHSDPPAIPLTRK